MIIGDRVNKVSAEIKDRSTYDGMKINVIVNDVREVQDKIEIDYSYNVDYGKYGVIKIDGTIVADEEGELKNKILNEWKEKKKIPEEFADRFFNTVNFLGSAHGTIIARVLNMRPPIIPPRLVKR